MPHLTDEELAAIEARNSGQDVPRLVAELRRLRGLRDALNEHFRATSTWTREFQPGGVFDGVLPPGSDITIDGGRWLVERVKAAAISSSTEKPV